MTPVYYVERSLVEFRLSAFFSVEKDERLIAALSLLFLVEQGKRTACVNKNWIKADEQRDG